MPFRNRSIWILHPLGHHEIPYSSFKKTSEVKSVGFGSQMLDFGAFQAKFILYDEGKGDEISLSLILAIGTSEDIKWGSHR